MVFGLGPPVAVRPSARPASQYADVGFERQIPGSAASAVDGRQLRLWTTAATWTSFVVLFQKASATLPSDAAVRAQHAVVVNAPASYFVVSAPFDQVLDGHAIPEETSILAASIYALEVHRPGPRSLTVRPHGGFLAPPGSAPPEQEPQRFNPYYSFQGMDTIFHPGKPFQVGERRWLRWNKGGFADWQLPAVGESVTLPKPSW